MGDPPAGTAPDPLEEFKRLLQQAEKAEPEAGTAMTLATTDSAGRPSARVVLLKAVDARGFSFYTNYESRKARELEENGWAALCFFWPTLERQVRVEGAVERLPGEESDAYFARRPRGSQLAAWASRQSAPLLRREDLLSRHRQVEERYRGAQVPRPPFWGGYLLRPERVEFWRGMKDRLHERLVYQRRGDGWETQRLFP